MIPSAADLARRLADELEGAGISHAIGGALALGVWGFPRATNDVDLDVFVTTDHLDPVFDVLESTGCELDRKAALASAISRGEFRATLQGMRLEVFVPSIELYDSVEARIRQAPLRGRPAWFLSPEDLAIFKFLFFRTKDILDVERLVAFAPGVFDRSYVRSWLVDLVGDDDERVTRWDRLVQDVDGLDGS